MNRIVDKNNVEIHNGDRLIFENGSSYCVVELNKVLYLSCENKELPLFELDKITIGHRLSSGSKCVL